MNSTIQDKIITVDQLPGIFSPALRSTHKIAFTNGCFDIIHRGHIHYLSKAREKADMLVVGLNTDASVKRLKGADRPFKDERTRAEVLASMQFIDYVILFGEDTPIKLINLVRPDILIKGGDYEIKDIVGSKEVISYGGRVETIPFLEGYSSSDLIKKIR